MHLPHDGKALSQRFFFLRQLRQTLEDLAVAVESAGEVALDESLAADMMRNRTKEEPVMVNSGDRKHKVSTGLRK